MASFKSLKAKVQKQAKQVKKEEKRGDYERAMYTAGKKVTPHKTPGRGKRIMTKYKVNRVAKKALMGK